MHKIALTEAGQQLARERTDFNTDDAIMYPDNRHVPGQKETWTVADDILILLDSPANVTAASTDYRKQQEAIVEALSRFHPRVLIIEGFRQLCILGMVDCVYNMFSAMEEATVVFAALANPIRLHILRVALNNPSTVGELKRAIRREQASIYHHIQKLKAVGLLYSLGHGEGYVTDGEVLVSVVKALVSFFYPEEEASSD